MREFLALKFRLMAISPSLKLTTQHFTLTFAVRFLCFSLAVAVTLGLPSALENWTNEQVLKFILLMWEQMRNDRERDPLNLLPQCDRDSRTAAKDRKPLDPSTVVAVAKKAYASLGEAGGNGESESVTLLKVSRRHSEPSLDCPLVEDAVMIEADTTNNTGMQDDFSELPLELAGDGTNKVMDLNSTDLPYDGQTEDICGDSPIVDDESTSSGIGGAGVRPGIRAPSETSHHQDAAIRKRRNVDWLCQHVMQLHQLSQIPFNSAEMWRLHLYFFSLSIAQAPASGNARQETSTAHASTVTNSAFSSSYTNGEPGDVLQSNESIFSASAYRPNSVISEPCGSGSALSFLSDLDPAMSELALQSKSPSPTTMTRNSMPVGLGRKVSYRSLTDAFASQKNLPPRDKLKGRGRKISTVIEEGISGSLAMQPRSKRARNNRSRISFFSRIKVIS